MKKRTTTMIMIASSVLLVTAVIALIDSMREYRTINESLELYDEIQAERRQAVEERAGKIDSCLNVTEQLLQEGDVTLSRITEVISSYEPMPTPGRVPIPR